MNGFEIMAKSYNKFLTDAPELLTQEERNDLTEKAKVCEILAELNENERLHIFDTGAFNDVVKGYVARAAELANVPRNTRAELLRALAALFDAMSAKQAAEYYRQ